MFPAEDSPRGLGRTLGKRVGGNPSRVRISYPPPVPHRARCRRAPPFAVGPFDVVRLSFRLSWFSGAPRARRQLAARLSRSMVPVTCMYRARIRAAPPGSQPMIESITTSGTPRISRTVAAVWRASWRRPSRTPAPAEAVSRRGSRCWGSAVRRPARRRRTPLPSQSAPAAIRSRSWASWCWRRILISGLGRPMVRRPARDLVDLCSRRVCTFFGQ